MSSEASFSECLVCLLGQLFVDAMFVLRKWDQVPPGTWIGVVEGGTRADSRVSAHIFLHLMTMLSSNPPSLRGHSSNMAYMGFRIDFCPKL